MTATSAGVARQGRAERPGLRTFSSARFRVVVAALLLIVGGLVLGSTMLRQASDPTGQFAIDFADYHQAAARISAGGSPYAPEMLLGPVPAQGVDRYRYPPPLAQLLVPLAGLPLATAAWIWMALQALAVLAAVWIAGTVGGAARSAERLLWSAVAGIWFLPVFDTLWKGNVSGFVALGVVLVVLGGAAATVGSVAGVALKLVPVTLLPAAFLPATRRSWIIGALGAVALVAVSVAISPRAWQDYAVVLPNLLAGSADYATNLAPDSVASHLGLADGLAGVVRIGSLVGAGAALVLSAVLARRPGGIPAAVVLGTVAMLLLPDAVWYHYLAVLLPLAALAWRAASPRARVLLLSGGALVSAALAWLPLALAGATLMVGGTLLAVWPRAGGRSPVATLAAARTVARAIEA